MKLFKVYNGYRSGCWLYVIVLAQNEERARELAVERYKKLEMESGNPREDAWTRLGVELLTENVVTEYTSEVFED